MFVQNGQPYPIWNGACFGHTGVTFNDENDRMIELVPAASEVTLRQSGTFLRFKALFSGFNVA